MASERKYFNADKLINTIYNKIALWHNNDDRLSNVELGRELKFLSRDIAEDVIREVFGDSAIKVDTNKLEVTDEEMASYQKEKKERRESLEERLKDAVKKEDEEAAS